MTRETLHLRTTFAQIAAAHDAAEELGALLDQVRTVLEARVAHGPPDAMLELTVRAIRQAKDGDCAELTRTLAGFREASAPAAMPGEHGAPPLGAGEARRAVA